MPDCPWCGAAVVWRHGVPFDTDYFTRHSCKKLRSKKPMTKMERLFYDRLFTKPKEEK